MFKKLTGCRWRHWNCSLKYFLLLQVILCLVCFFTLKSKSQDNDAIDIPKCSPIAYKRSMVTLNSTLAYEEDALSDEILEIKPGIKSADGKYVIHPYAFMGDEPQENAMVCLGTFTTVSRIHWLFWSTKSWSGPISVAVFTPGDDYASFTLILRLLRKCAPEVVSRISFHLLYPVNKKPIELENNFHQLHECPEPSVLFEQIKSTKMEISYEKLPQNHLRNLARQTCDTPYNLMADIDMIPVPLMFERLSLFLKSQSCEKCAFIAPVYEIISSSPVLPASKPALIKMISEKQAQQYHVKVYKPNQGNSDLNSWETKQKYKNPKRIHGWSLSETFWANFSSTEDFNSSISVPFKEMYSIPKYQEFWEPVVVLPSEAPIYDERFIGYGYTRNSFVYELNVRGYSFHMLDEAFFSHWGFQLPGVRNKARNSETSYNSHLYKTFKRELTVKFPPKNIIGRLRAANPTVLRSSMIRRPPLLQRRMHI